MSKRKHFISYIASFVVILSVTASCQVLGTSSDLIEPSDSSIASLEMEQSEPSSVKTEPSSEVTETSSERTEPAGAEKESSSTEESQTSSTGYMDGGIQFSTVFYDGQLYIVDQVVGVFSEDDLDAKLIELDAEEVGIIKTETNRRWPSEDFEASRLPVSVPVYYDEEGQLLYVALEDAELRMLVPYEEDLYDLD